MGGALVVSVLADILIFMLGGGEDSKCPFLCIIELSMNFYMK